MWTYIYEWGRSPVKAGRGVGGVGGQKEFRSHRHKNELEQYHNLLEPKTCRHQVPLINMVSLQPSVLGTLIIMKHTIHVRVGGVEREKGSIREIGVC